MKRDMVLILKILEYVQDGEGDLMLPMPTVDGYEDKAVEAHIDMCDEEGLMKVQNTLGGPVGIFELTWKGRDLLSELRGENRH